MRNIDLTFASSNFSNITAQKKQTHKEKFYTYRRVCFSSNWYANIRRIFFETFHNLKFKFELYIYA